MRLEPIVLTAAVVSLILLFVLLLILLLVLLLILLFVLLLIGIAALYHTGATLSTRAISTMRPPTSAPGEG